GGLAGADDDDTTAAVDRQMIGQYLARMGSSDGGGEQVAQQALRVEGHGGGLLQIDSSPQMPRAASGEWNRPTWQSGRDTSCQEGRKGGPEAKPLSLTLSHKWERGLAWRKPKVRATPSCLSLPLPFMGGDWLGVRRKSV